MPKVAFLVPSDSPIIPAVRSACPEDWDLVQVDVSTAPLEEQKRVVGEADFALVFFTRMTPELVLAGKKLRLVQLLSAGFDNFPIAQAGEMGILVANASGTNSQGVAELALTLMLASYRHLLEMDQDTRSGRWRTERTSGNDSYEIQDKTIGIVGLGNIGSITARILQGFNPTILYHDIRARPDLEEELDVKRTPLDDLLRESDIVTLHVPLDDSTRKLISERELRLMKPSAILINTCRGPVVDEAALYRALSERRIWGAGIDVFEQEPVDPQNPILKLDNVVVTPHAAGQTAESYPRRVELAFANMRRVLSGEAPRNLVLPN